MTIELFFRLLGSLALLIYGMKTMSDALQKLAGPSLRHILGRMTGNRLSGMLTGTMVTCAVQSSSAWRKPSQSSWEQTSAPPLQRGLCR